MSTTAQTGSGATIAVGDGVVITDGNGRSFQHRSGTVTKVARVWITVQPEQTHQWVPEPTRYRLDTQDDGGDYSWKGQFYTLEQWAARERQEAAEAFLNEQGIRVDWESPWRDRKVELADVLRAHLDAEAAKTTGPVDA